MKKAISDLALLVALSAGAAEAADLPSRKGPPPAYLPPPPVMTWTGFYVGGNIGGGWRSRNNAGGGVQAGHNYQLTPRIVAGVETDFQGASIGNTSWNTPYPVDPADRIHWFGAVRGRLGVTAFSPNLLVYGTGGFAYGEVRSPWSGYSDVRTGWTAGGGLEYLVSPNWSAKVEYLYTISAPTLLAGAGTAITGTPSSARSARA